MHGWLRRNWGTILVGLGLWIASNVFVTGIATFARWETGAQYHKIKDLCEWDCGWYGSVIEPGYERYPENNTGYVNWPFHPLFPYTVYPIYKVFHLSLTTSLVLTSKLEFLAAIYAFLLLVRDPRDTTTENIQAGSLVAFNPYLIYGHAGYAEPLYFTLTAVAFYLLARREWIWSGIAASFLSVTRLVGSAFAISYLIAWARDNNWRLTWRKDQLPRLLGLLLCPLGAAIFMLYMYHLTGDALVQSHVQAAWGKIPGNPFKVVLVALNLRMWARVWGLMALASFAASLLLIWWRKVEMGVYLAVTTLIPLSAGFVGLPRYVWWQPPFLLVAWVMVKRWSWLWPLYLVFSGGVAAFMIVEWFSGHPFVI
jgi:hypothetical protein